MVKEVGSAGRTPGWRGAGAGERCPGKAPWVIADPACLCVSSLGMANTKLIYINQTKTSLANAERDVPILLLPMSLFACASSSLHEQPRCQAKQRKQSSQRRYKGL